MSLAHFFVLVFVFLVVFCFVFFCSARQLASISPFFRYYFSLRPALFKGSACTRRRRRLSINQEKKTNKQKNNKSKTKTKSHFHIIMSMMMMRMVNGGAFRKEQRHDRLPASFNPTTCKPICVRVIKSDWKR